MDAFKTIIWIVNIFSSLAIIGLVLMQHGRGADAGASFGGSGSAQGVFGSGGNANFLTRMTGIAATVFFASCLALGYIHTNSNKKGGLDFSDVQQSSSVSIPAQQTETPSVSASSVVLPAVASAVGASEAKVASQAESGSGLANAGIAAATGAAVGATAAKVVADKAEAKKAEATTNNSKAKTAKNTKKQSNNSEKSKQKAK